MVKIKTTPLSKQPKTRRFNEIKTISQSLENKYEFDSEVNRYLYLGWQIKSLEIIKSRDEIILLGIMIREIC